MVNRKDELLAAIDDDQTRLVYADFLEDEGDHDRALLIRRQCEAAALPAWDRRAIEARWEADRLVAEHGDAWRAELPVIPGVKWLGFERGFIASVEVDNLATLYAHQEAIAAAAPVVTKVAFAMFDEREIPVPDGGVPWLRTIALRSSPNLNAAATGSLLEQVEELELQAVHGWTIGRILTEQTGDVPLRRVVLTGDHALGGSVGTWLAANPRAKHLRELRSGTTWIDHDTGYFNDPTLREQGAAALARTPLNDLVVLELARQRVTSAGLATLLAATPNVRELDASACELVGLQAFAHPGASLVRLDLSHNHLRDEGLVSLLAYPRAATLESLRLDTCELGEDAVAALVASPCWQTLRVLDLSRNPLGVAGAAALAAAPRPAHLHTLKLANCDLDDGAARVLASGEWLDQLLAVDLSSNTVATELVAALTGVRVILLAGAILVGDRERMLAPIWPRAVEVDLSGVSLGRLLPDTAPELQRLSLSGCTLNFPEIAYLLAPEFPHLHHLNLAGCEVARDELVTRLVEHGAGAVRELDLRRTEFTPEQVLMLARALAPRVDLKLHGAPWTYPPKIREELARLIGPHWYSHADDPDEDEEEG